MKSGGQLELPRVARVADALTEVCDHCLERDRLQYIYIVSTLLLRFESVDRTVPAVLAVLARGIPLRSAIFMRKTEGSTQTLLWQPVGEQHRLREAKAHAQRSYVHLGLYPAEEKSRKGKRRPPQRTQRSALESEAADGKYLVLPFALTDGTIFGALLLECLAPPDEFDVVFANVVVNQMAIALDRHERIAAEKLLAESRRVAAESRENSWHFLSDLSSVLASSLDYRTTLANLARLAVPILGEVCLVDVLSEDGSPQRLAAALSDRERFASVGELVIVPGVSASVMEASAHPIHGDALHAAGLRSIMVVPLRAREGRLGVLTFFATDADRYSPADVAVAEEIARRVALTINNAQLYERAQAAVKGREELLAMVSHDLKSPLSVVIMILTMLLKEPEREERRKHGRKQLEAMKRAAGRMTGLLGDILDSASMDAGQFSVEPSQVVVAPLVAEAIETAQVSASRKYLTLQSDIPSDVLLVRADAPRIQQVLANLLGNAVKFTPAHGKISVRAYRSGDASGDSVTFSVADNGPGIPEEDRAHLFDRFWQAPVSAKMGTGLGLFIARAIVEAHGGKIWVESNAGAGSTFLFRLPAVSPESLPAARAHAS